MGVSSMIGPENETVVSRPFPAKTKQEKLSRVLAVLKKPFQFYAKEWKSRPFWVDNAAQGSFSNLFIALIDMFWSHANPAVAAVGRFIGVGQGVAGVCKGWSAGRNWFHKKLKVTPATNLLGRFGADTSYSFLFNIPSFAITYGLGYAISRLLGHQDPGAATLIALPITILKSSIAFAPTGPINGIFVDTFNALDSDDPELRAKALKPIRWALIDRFDLETRKKLMWGILATSTVATAAVYTFAKGGFLNR